ncbi:hypothetical protein K491DRAFT_679040 [Lophiostoma macrostomum CBS 122681]|uniref:Uncharacterized protein n=1 Tax=Lophiostoma macrostomum CBS 122681 TaxID=1314788 RepID=A0A6A6T9F2_9PLEO|nr:hypothetical protein K491DRAFT_679040 [Lophiostoma macrostomum CBS 122681]
MKLLTIFSGFILAVTVALPQPVDNADVDDLFTGINSTTLDAIFAVLGEAEEINNESSIKARWVSRCDKCRSECAGCVLINRSMQGSTDTSSCYRETALLPLKFPTFWLPRVWKRVAGPCYIVQYWEWSCRSGHVGVVTSEWPCRSGPAEVYLW